MSFGLTKQAAALEIAAWTAANAIHVGWGWHSPEHGGNAVIRLLLAAGANVEVKTDGKGDPFIVVNGAPLDPWGKFTNYLEGRAMIDRALGLPFNLVDALLEASERHTHFDATVMDFVTDFAAGTEAMRQYVETHLIPLLPDQNWSQHLNA